MRHPKSRMQFGFDFYCFRDGIGVKMLAGRRCAESVTRNCRGAPADADVELGSGHHQVLEGRICMCSHEVEPVRWGYRRSGSSRL